MGDDGIGVHILREMQNTYGALPNVTMEEAQTGGMNLIDLMRGYDKAILVDAVSVPTLLQGEVACYPIHDMTTVHSSNPHDVSLLEALELSKRIGDTMLPQEIVIVAINLTTIPRTFTEAVSPEIRDAIPKAIEKIFSELSKTHTEE